MIKIEVIEVSMDLKEKETLHVKSEMIDLEDAVPSTGKKYVMLTFEAYQALTGVKPVIKLKPKKRKAKK